jgi:hypothetical protein
LSKEPPEASLSDEKVEKVLACLADKNWSAHTRRELPLLEVQQIHGLLNFVAMVLVAGRMHLTFTVMALGVASKRGSATLTKGWAEELDWWRRVVSKWNRVALLFPPEYALSPFSFDDSPATDACRSKEKLEGGAGGFFLGFYWFFSFTELECATLDIYELEGYTMCLFLDTMLRICPEKISGRRFRMRNDNMAWVTVVGTNKAKGKPVIAFLLNWLHEMMARFSFTIHLDYVQTDLNYLADPLSRLQIERFLREARTHWSATLPLVRLQVPDRYSVSSQLISLKSSIG